MKNPWLNYILIRLGIFVAILIIMLAIGFDPFFAALVAAVVSLSISLIFFGKQRNAVSEAIYKRTTKNKLEGIEDKDSDVENKIIDDKP
jgi:ABC-type bacteriocin/lantibiotic exporter with double-glycine peptidase domain